MSDFKERVQKRVEEILPELIGLSNTVWEHPEYNFEEFHACQSMSELLKKFGFEVTTGVGGIETSVKAVYDTGKEGPNIGIFGEFDAVPGMGHSCGHNLMCAMAVGAGEAVHSVIDDIGGKVTVFGTPAEEGGGGKIIMLNNGAFKELDIAMILHSASDTVVNDISYSRTDLIVDYYGKTSHAATWPEEGISALNPILDLFQIVNSMRLELADKGKILGIISKGGEEPIYIPDHCQARFTIRSFSMKYKLELLERFKKICEHVAEITNTRLEISDDGLAYEDIRNNQSLEEALRKNFTDLGEIVKPRERALGIGCTDMGNVTHEIPGLQSYVLVVPETRGHTKEFEDACYSEAGHKTIAVGSKAMAMTAVDVLTNPELLEAIRRDFKEMKEKYE